MNEAEFIQLIVDILPGLLTIGLTILSVLLGTRYRKFKKFFITIIDILDAINTAIIDDEVTLEEIQDIIKTIKQLQNDE